MAKPQQTPDFVLFADWETTGATFGGDSSIDYQGISLGAVVARTSDWTEVGAFEQLIQFNADKYKWTDEAERIHGLSREHLAANGVPQEQAAENFLEFLFKYFGTGKIMFGGHNEEFDRRFTNQLFNSVGIEFAIEKSGKFETNIPLHHVTINTAGIGFVNFGLFKSDLLFTAVGVPERGIHRAIDDARAALQVVQVSNLAVKAGLSG